jgi:hypothetical protein
MRADSLYREAENDHKLNCDEYLRGQRELMHRAEVFVSDGEDDE